MLQMTHVTFQRTPQSPGSQLPVLTHLVYFPLRPTSQDLSFPYFITDSFHIISLVLWLGWGNWSFFHAQIPVFETLCGAQQAFGKYGWQNEDTENLQYILPSKKALTSHSSNSMTNWKRQNLRDRKKISGCRLYRGSVDRVLAWHIRGQRSILSIAWTGHGGACLEPQHLGGVGRTIRNSKLWAGYVVQGWGTLLSLCKTWASSSEP